MRKSIALIIGLVFVLGLGIPDALARKKTRKKKKKKTNVTKIIPAKEFKEALVKLGKDERVPVASSTLVEKGRGKDYYSVEKMFDNDLESFWAEGKKGAGAKEWVVFHLPDDSTHVEVVPGAGKEQFENFNRPRRALLDYYLVKFKREKGTDELKPNFRWVGRSRLEFKDKPDPIRIRIPVKLPELALSVRTIYVGVLILQKAYRGQFADTSIAELRTSAVWGER